MNVQIKIFLIRRLDNPGSNWESILNTPEKNFVPHRNISKTHCTLITHNNTLLLIKSVFFNNFLITFEGITRFYKNPL